MKKKRVYQIFLIAIVLIFTFSEIPVAHAVGPGPNAVLGFIRTLEALNKRNQIYREAGATAKEIQTYYDTLIDKTKTMRDDIIHQAARGEDVTGLIRAYTRIEAGLIAERKIAIQMVEAEKKGARADFRRRIRKEVFNILIASPSAQKLLKDIRETIDGLRQAANTVKDALSASQPTEFLARQLSERLGKTRWTKKVVHILGSAVAEEFDERMGGIFTRLEQPSKLVLAELDGALMKIDELDLYMAKYQNQEKTPTSLKGSWESFYGFQELDPSQSGEDAVATAYTNKAEDMNLFEGTDVDLESMRDWIRGTLLGARVDYLQIEVKSRSKFVSCISTDRDKYLKAMGELGLEPEEPLNPDKAGYLVCYVIPTEEETEGLDHGSYPPIKYAYAALIGLSKANAAAQADDAEAQTAETEPQPVFEEDGQESQADAASCDALEYLSFELVEGPIEETSDLGSYYCYVNYSLTNTHSSSSIVLSWKHDISSRDAGPYWTHPKLGPGESYYVPLTLRSDKDINGHWSTIDADYLMAWFATEECSRYKSDYWPTEEEPDKLLTAGFKWIEIDNPCRR